MVLLDFILNLIWLPIGVHNTWGFRSAHDAFMTTYNGTGAPPVWNWCLSYLATAGILIGFDASGHIAEETKNASITAARGIFWSTVASGVGGLATIILFLFCAVSLSVANRWSLLTCNSLIPIHSLGLVRHSRSYLSMPQSLAKGAMCL
jgi:amino acid transporter